MTNYIEEQLNVLKDAYEKPIYSYSYPKEVLQFLLQEGYLRTYKRVRNQFEPDYFIYVITEKGKLHLYESVRSLETFTFNSQANTRSWLALLIAVPSAVMSLITIILFILKAYS